MNINRVEVKMKGGQSVLFRNRMALGFLVWYEREHLGEHFGGVERSNIISVRQGLYQQTDHPLGKGLYTPQQGA